VIRRTRLLRPRLPSDAVPRPALIERLDAGLRGPLTLLATPPGYGKTTLLSEWAARCLLPVAWLSVDEHGDDLPSFVAYVVAAIQTVAPGIGEQTLRSLDLADPPSPHEVAAMLTDELLDLVDEIALVLDDYHQISDLAVHRFVGALVDVPPSGFHVVLATRADPPLPLSRLRMRGQLTELRAPELRFSADETKAFFEQSAGLAVDATALAAIEQRAEGWAAGLRLAALSLRDCAPPTTVLDAFEGRQLRGVMDFLVDDLLAAQPEDLRRLLLSTSIVERVCAGLAGALLDEGITDAAAALDRVAWSNLFLLPLDEDPDWYRYHALFRLALRDRLGAAIGREELAALHARASAWLAEHGLIDEAIRHAKAAGDEEGAALIVERAFHTALYGGGLSVADSWVRLLAPEVLERRPALILARSWSAYLRGRSALHGRLIEEAAASLAAHAETLAAPARAALQGELALGRSIRLLDDGDAAGAAEAARRALRLLPASDRLNVSLASTQEAMADFMDGRGDAAVSRLTRAIAEHEGPPDVVHLRRLAALMRIQAYMGNLHESARVAGDLLRLASDAGASWMLTWAHEHLGAVAYESNDLDAALVHFGAVVADPEHTHAGALRDATFGLACTQRALGLHREAWVTLDRLQEYHRQAANLEQAALVRALQLHLAPEGADAMELTPSAGVRRDSSWRTLLGSPDVIRVQLLLNLATAESLAAAETLLRDLLEYARFSHFTAREIELSALAAVLAQIRGRDDEAAAALEHAIDLAAGGGFVRTFLDRGPLLAAVLRTLRRRSRHGPAIDRLLAAFAAEASPRAEHGGLETAPATRPSHAVDALTEREQEILAKLAARLSYKEIADALVISPFTVKAHASNIYGKLGASGRREAIATARSLGLIAPA
jgi:LuxR family maltose regulon positive regulatory protein